MSNVFEFPKDKKKHIDTSDHCISCQKEFEKDEERKYMQNPFETHVEIFALCNECLGISREHGVHL